MNDISDARGPVRPRFAADRFLIYVMSFAGLMAVVYGFMGFLQILAALVLNTAGMSSGVSGEQVRVQASYDLAATGVGLVLWLVCRRLMRRRIAGNPAEVNAAERRLFLAAIFAVTSVVTLFFLEEFVHAILQSTTGGPLKLDLRSLVVPVSVMVAYGGTWLAYARVGWRERSFRLPDAPHDFALYLATSFALGLFLYGVQYGIWQIIADVQGRGGGWREWIEPLSWATAGGLVWLAASAYDLVRGGRRQLRVLHLYVMLAFSVGFSLSFGIGLSTNVLLNLFGSDSDWTTVIAQLPYLMPAATMWCYYWAILRHQNSYATTTVAGGAIPWPRRPAIATMCLAGLILGASSVIGLAWTGLDALLSRHAAEAGWWTENISRGIAGAALGGALWLGGWITLQHAIARDETERDTWERRWFLFAVTALSALAVLGATVGAIFIAVSRILGTTAGGELSLHEAYAGTVVLFAGAILAHYGTLFLRERRRRGGRPATLEISALVTPSAGPAVALVTAMDGVRVNVVGTIASGVARPEMSMESILAALADHRHARGERVWLVLSAEGGCLYRYAPGRPTAPQARDAPMAAGQLFGAADG